MSIATYANLRAAVSNFSGRADLADAGSNAARTLEFITLAETRMNRDLARIAAGEIVTTSALSTTAEAIDLPADFNGFRLLAINGANTEPLTYMTPESLVQSFVSTAAGKPKAYTLHGKDGASEVVQARFRPIPDSTYTLLAYYYKKVATIVGTADGSSNWMLTNNPDCYLYAALVEVGLFYRDEERARGAMDLYNKALSDVKDLDRARRVGGGSPRASPGVRVIKGM